MTYAAFDVQPQQERLAPPVAWAAKRETNGLAWAGLISSTLAVMPGFALLSGSLSVAGVLRSRRTGTGLGAGIAGLALSVLLGIVSMILMASVALPALIHQGATNPNGDVAGIERLGSTGGNTSLGGTDLGTGSETRYLNALKDSDTSDVWSEFSDDDLVAAAEFVCGAAGESDFMVTTGVALVSEAGFSADEAADVTATAVIHYCPEHAAAAEASLYN